MILVAIIVQTSVIVGVLTWQHRDTARTLDELAAIVEYLSIQIDRERSGR